MSVKRWLLTIEDTHSASPSHTNQTHSGAVLPH